MCSVAVPGGWRWLPEVTRSAREVAPQRMADRSTICSAGSLVLDQVHGVEDMSYRAGWAKTGPKVTLIFDDPARLDQVRSKSGPNMAQAVRQMAGLKA